MLELNIRYAEKKDIKVLKKFDPMYKYFGKRMVDQVPIILAEIDGEIIAYLIYNCTDYCYEFDHVYVAEPYRKKYVASALMLLLTNKIMGEDDGFKRLFVECVVQEKDLARTIEKVKFLRKLGFTVVEIDEDGYLLRYERPEVAVMRITASNRMEAWYPESFPEILGDPLD
jgi:N-acetylglutamate synthase-like GNAT family acetyltransferase